MLEQAEARRSSAHAILNELGLLQRWAAIGEPILVGATAYGLMVAPDIDMEIYCDQPKMADACALLGAYAGHPRIKEIRCVDELAGPDQGIYCRLRYQHESGELWKVDMWLMAHDHPGPQSRSLVEPMQRALTDETRAAILSIKQFVISHHGGKIGSIHIYRGVLQGGVRSPEEFMAWYAREKPAGLTTWTPE